MERLNEQLAKDRPANIIYTILRLGLFHIESSDVLGQEEYIEIKIRASIFSVVASQVNTFVEVFYHRQTTNSVLSDIRIMGQNLRALNTEE